MTETRSLAEVLAVHDCVVSESQLTLLQQYCEDLWEWNTRLNLTRHTDYDAFVTRDLHDSQQLLHHIQDGESILDVGAGGGVPGILLAVLNPSLNVSLSESTQKKAAALEAMVEGLGVPVSVFVERGEDVIRRNSFDTITARAVAPLKKLIPWFRPQKRKVGRLLLIKGPSWQSERDEAEEAGLLRGVGLAVLSEYATAGRDGRSVIIEVRYR